MNNSSNNSTLRLIILLLIIGLVSVGTKLYVDWLWFDSVNYSSVFKTILLNKYGLYAGLFVIAFLWLAANLLLTRKNIEKRGPRPLDTDDEREIIYLNPEKMPWKDIMTGKSAKWVFIGISALGAFLVSSLAADNWIIIQQFLNRVPMGVADPIFSKDIGFYFFNLTFYRFIYNILMMTMVITIVLVALTYMVSVSSDLLLMGDWRQYSFAGGHLAVLLAIVFILKSWGYKLAAYDLLFSSNGIVFGAAYSDVSARLPAFKVLMVITLIVALIMLANVFIKRLNWIFISVGAWIVLSFVLSNMYPGIIQKLVVQPNEYNKEKPYIENAIEFTRQAYGLNKIENQEFQVDYDLDITDPDNQDTITNIRLWDWQPLQTTYKNLQQLRYYYVFNDVDIDRYMVNGEYRQVMLSAREFDSDSLTEKTWINQRLMYTHGYGVLMSPVNEVAEEGFPEFFIKDIPPKSSSNLEIKRPEIYFGEITDNYVMVNTEQKEFDYPMGTENVWTTYEGNAGIKINSFFRRLLLAWELKDYKMILSSDITNESQVLIYRNIMERIGKIAPYLGFDSDPYIVLNDDGRLYWILDAYTYSNRYPYSQPFDERKNNYIRNSVKITCDAYTGDMQFYVADETDPIIKTFTQIFPQVYKPLSSMPEGLRAHIRYPVDIFSIQSNMYRTFHMTDPNVFYNQEDPWVIPNEIVEDKMQKMEPYYIIMRLPGSEKAEYILMLPFTPNNRPNMIAWMCARMDGDNYGKMLVYNFPKQETVYGPEQIESRINQNTEISQQISLWDQRGTRVYRGNLLVIPMNNSILYIEPLYLQAENSKLPELKRVIAGFENKIV
ncbi:MAG: UPF0182 family protein, partial [Syntrophomonadaceae bacterium]|nr:UPF0182 family protein [Syntrophomonadaceae bacterium]